MSQEPPLPKTKRQTKLFRSEDTVKVLKICLVAFVLLFTAIVFTSLVLQSEKAATTPPPNIYELTRQTAENTRHIFWLIAAGFIGIALRLSFPFKIQQ